MSEPSLLEARLTEVEMQLMHLQRDFEHLNAECLRQQKLINDQQSRLKSLERALGERIAQGIWLPMRRRVNFKFICRRDFCHTKPKR